MLLLHKFISPKQITIFAALSFITILTVGCKYEQGPLFSFLKEEDRLARGWKFSKVTLNKVSITNGSYDSLAYTGSYIGFSKEPTRFTYSISDLHYKHKGTFVYSGEWSLENDKKILTLKYDDTSIVKESYTILQFTENNLNLSKTDLNGDNIEYNLVPGVK